MGCRALQEWYLRHRVPAINLASEHWHEALSSVGMTEAGATSCLRRLSETGAIRHIKRGLYVVVDPSREAQPAAIASAAAEPVPHYVTTDAALVIHGLIDQPVTSVTVVLEREGMRPFSLGHIEVRPVTLKASAFAAADAYRTTTESYAIHLASRGQAVVDALAKPDWMTHFTLLPEVLGVFDDREVAVVASAALARSRAAAQRLGFLLGEIGRPVPAVLSAFLPRSVIDLVPGRTPTFFSSRWRLRA